MTVLSDYVSGTLSLTQGSTAFTGTGTGWSTAGFREGDTIIDLTGATEFTGVIASIDSETSGTLTKAWEGPNLSSVAYRMRYQPDGSRVAAQARTLIELLGNGNLQSLAGLSGTLNALPMFTGPGAMTLVPKTDLITGVAYDVQVDTLADRAAYDAQAEGYTVLVSDVGDGRSAIYSKASNTSGDWTAPAYITAQPRMDILVDDPGKPGSGEVILVAAIPLALTFAANMAGSYVVVGTNPTASAAYSITKNGVEFATLTISTSGSGTFACSQTTFAAGDVLRVVAPNPRDATLSGVSMTLAATR